MNRRAFLEQTIGAGAVVAAGPVIDLRAQGRGVLGANDRVRMAIVGSGGRGNQDLDSFGKLTNNVFVSACDVFKERLDSTVQRLSANGNKVDGYEDYRRVLDRKDIDALLVATPDHWHSQIVIDACAAGKDCYVEKPVSNTIAPAVKMLQAARKYNRVVQVGTQQRSWGHFQEAAKLLQSGVIGTVSKITHQYPGGGSPEMEPVAPVPAGLNWDMFQGPAPQKPYKYGRHRSWRYYWDYGGGLVTDWGVHVVDTAHHFMGTNTQAPNLTTAVAQYVDVQHPDVERPQNAFIVTWQYDKFVMSFTNAVLTSPDFSLEGSIFFGSRGALVVNRNGYQIRPNPAGGGGRGRGRGQAAPGGVAPGPAVKALPPLEAKTVSGGVRSETIVVATTAHAANFLDCVKSRERPVANIEIGFYSSLPCLLGIMAIRQGKAFTWDAESMTPKAV
jgi:predicted dehydrogenase